jgi:hypothetical protein
MGDDGGCGFYIFVVCLFMTTGIIIGAGVSNTNTQAVKAEAVDRGFAKYVADNKGCTKFVWEEPTNEK